MQILETHIKEQKGETEKFKNNQMTNNQAWIDTICKAVTSAQNSVTRLNSQISPIVNPRESLS